jgi:predicted amidohydrolase
MQKNPETTVAIVHGSIELGKLDQNIQRIEEISEKAKDEGVDILILPSMINGVPIFEIKKNLRIKRSAETIPGRTAEYLARIANKCNLYIVAGPILERRGSKIYRSAFVIEPTMNIKSIVSQLHTPLGYGQGSAPPIVFVKNASIGIFIAEDIQLPELTLLMKMSGIDLALFYPYPQITPEKIISILKTRALELNVMVISIGCTVKRKNEEIIFVPTTIIDENGIVVHEILDKTIKMVKILIPNIHRRELMTMSTAYKKLLKILCKTIMYHIKGT